MKTIFSLVLLLSSFAVAAQGLTKTYDETCSCYVVTNHYDNGQVSSIHHENDQGQKNGTEVVNYANGSKQYERNWKNGKLDGAGTHYHQDGAVYYEERHESGKKVGAWKFRDTNGDLIQVIHYTGTKDDGTYEYYHAGVNYFTQKVESGKMISEQVLNQEIYDQLIAEAEAAKDAKK